RVGGGDQGRRRREDHARRLRADVGQRRGRRRGDEGRVVVLADSDDVEPDLLCLLGDLHGRLDALVLRRRPTRRRVWRHVSHGEDAELHVYPVPLIVADSTIRLNAPLGVMIPGPWTSVHTCLLRTSVTGPRRSANFATPGARPGTTGTPPSPPTTTSSGAALGSTVPPR